jgi:hypothetical protein
LNDRSFLSDMTNGDGSRDEDEPPRGRTLKRQRLPGLTEPSSWTDLNISWTVTEKPFPVIVDDRVNAEGRQISDRHHHTLPSPRRKRPRTSL